jgi:hypothetical protein
VRTTIASAVLLATFAAGCGPGSDQRASKLDADPITPDVKLGQTSCTADEEGARAEGTITNRSGRRATFEIVIEWYGRDGKYYTGTKVETASITPGDVATWEAHPGTPAAVGGVCEVVEVYEVPSPEGEAVGTVAGDGS